MERTSTDKYCGITSDICREEQHATLPLRTFYLYTPVCIEGIDLAKKSIKFSRRHTARAADS